VPLAYHPGREADHSPPSSAEIKEWVELYLHSPNTPSWRGAQGEHRDNFTFYLSRYEDFKIMKTFQKCEDGTESYSTTGVQKMCPTATASLG
jgi:hypothetical protein